MFRSRLIGFCKKQSEVECDHWKCFLWTLVYQPWSLFTFIVWKWDLTRSVSFCVPWKKIGQVLKYSKLLNVLVAKHRTQNVAYTMSNQICSQFNTVFLGFVGDTIASVNDTSVEGFRHKEIVQLIKSSGNSIRYVDTSCSTMSDFINKWNCHSFL